MTPIYAQNGQKSTKITCHGPLPTVTHNELKCSKNEDPAKITYSKMAFFSRPCFPCAHEQMRAQARARRPHEVPCGAAAATARARAATAAAATARARAATAADVAVRAVRGGDASAAHLDDVDGHREEVDPPSGGDSTRLGLEPRSHRQLLRTRVVAARAHNLVLPQS